MTLEEGTRVYWRRFNGQRCEGVVVWIADDVARVRGDGGKCWVVDVAKLRPVERQAPTMPMLTRSVDRDAIARARTVAVPKVKPARSRKYLAWLRAQPCVVCGSREDVEASHHGAHGTATKPSDHEALPVCRVHHHRWHQKGSPHMSWDHLTREEKRARFAFLAAEHRARFEVQGAVA